MRVMTLAVLMLAVSLAGCSDKPAIDEASEEFEGIAVQGVIAIRGIVVDTAVVPVGGAHVSIQGVELDQTTNEKGAFVFVDLEPGLYILKIQKPGFFPVTAQAAVQADGEPPLVRVVLDHDAATALFGQTTEYAGFLQCGAGLVATSWSVCQAPNGAVDIVCNYTGVCIPPQMAHRGIIEVPIDGVPDWTQAEAVWEAGQPGAQRLLWGGYTRTPGTIEFNNGTTKAGPSPVVLSWDQENNTKLDIGGVYDLVFQVYPTSDAGSIVLEQEVYLFVTAFYNYAPPEAWLFVEDGSYDPPR